MKFLFFSRYRFQNLLVCFFLYLLVGPFLEIFQYAHIVVDVFFSALLVVAVHAIHKQGKLLWVRIVLLSLTLLILWAGKLQLVPLSEKSMHLALCLYLGSLVYAFLQYIFSAKRIDSNLISATLCLYLIIGLLWGSVYILLETYIPGSFVGDLLQHAEYVSERLHHFNYFSFVTLTTLGYGDILPQTKGATALCQTEAIIGQFFTAVLVARLVGIQVAQEFSGDEQ